MLVKELINLLNTMPQDAEVATQIGLGKGMLSGIHGARQHTFKDQFGVFPCVILENGTYPVDLLD